MEVPVPFNMSLYENPSQQNELHLSFTMDFQQMSVEPRLQCLRSYVESLLKQAKTVTDEGTQRGLMTVIELTEQLIPHIQLDQVPLHEILIVEVGESADGSSLDELLSQK